jgi:diacylglycerol kinase
MVKKQHQTKFSLSRQAKSFKHAFYGISIFFKEEYNARIHLLAAVLVVIGGIVLKISVTEWVAVILSMGLVLTAEIINTSIENLADFVQPEKYPQIKKVKDLAAAAVLVTAIAAFIIGLIIFLPKLLALV